MRKHRYFLDANILVSWILWSGNERKLLEMGESGRVELYTSTYVLKEVEVALTELGLSSGPIIEALLFLRSYIRIVDPTEKEVKEHWDDLSDKSDVPVLVASLKSVTTLVTGDRKLRSRAAKYVEVKSTQQVLKELK